SARSYRTRIDNSSPNGMVISPNLFWGETPQAVQHGICGSSGRAVAHRPPLTACSLRSALFRFLQARPTARGASKVVRTHVIHRPARDIMLDYAARGRPRESRPKPENVMRSATELA